MRYIVTLLCLKTNIVSTPPEPTHRTVLQPDKTELAFMYATNRHTNLKSREKKGGLDIDMTSSNQSMLRARMTFCLKRYQRKKNAISHDITCTPKAQKLRSRPMNIFSFSRSRYRSKQRLRRRWSALLKPTTRVLPLAPLVLLALLLLIFRSPSSPSSIFVENKNHFRSQNLL